VPSLSVLPFKLKTVGHRSFNSARPRAWNSLPPSLREGALVCSDATPGTVSALLRRHLLATHFCGNSFDWSSVPTSSVVGKLADSVPIALRALRTTI